MARDLQSALQKKKGTLKVFLDNSGQNEEMLEARNIIGKLQWKIILQRRYADDKLKQYYDANKPFFDKIEVRASHILIKLPPNATKEQVDQAKQQILLLRHEIVTGKAKFDDVAKKYSQCPTKEKGGDIGQFPYKFLVVPGIRVCGVRHEKGEISDVVQTIFGLHLILVTDRTPGEASQLESMKDTVREVWAQDEELYKPSMPSNAGKRHQDFSAVNRQCPPRPVLRERGWRGAGGEGRSGHPLGLSRGFTVFLHARTLTPGPCPRPRLGLLGVGF